MQSKLKKVCYFQVRAEESTNINYGEAVSSTINYACTNIVGMAYFSANLTLPQSKCVRFHWSQNIAPLSLQVMMHGFDSTTIFNCTGMANKIHKGSIL